MDDSCGPSGCMIDTLVSERVIVDDGPVNMRSSAGTAASIIASLAMNAAGTVTDGPVSASGYTWYRLSTSSGTGWVADAFLARSSGGAPAGQLAVGNGRLVE